VSSSSGWLWACYRWVRALLAFFFLFILARVTSYHAYHNSLSLTLHSPLSPGPPNIGIFIGIQKMCTLPVVQMTEGGLLWFVDLTTRDPYFVLPVLCGVVANRALVVSVMVSFILTALLFSFSIFFFFFFFFFLLFWRTLHAELCLRKVVICLLISFNSIFSPSLYFPFCSAVGEIAI
jgi:hypothetical protein